MAFRRVPRGTSDPADISLSPSRVVVQGGRTVQIPPAPPKPTLLLQTPVRPNARVEFASPVVSPPPPANFAYMYPQALPSNPYTAAPVGLMPLPAVGMPTMMPAMGPAPVFAGPCGVAVLGAVTCAPGLEWRGDVSFASIAS